MIRNPISRLANIAGYAFANGKAGPDNPFPHMPRNAMQALSVMERTRYIDKNLANGFYAEKFVFLNTLPYSTSKVTAEMIALAQRRLGVVDFDANMTASGGIPTHETNFNLDVITSMESGGVYIQHLNPDSKTLNALSILGCKYIVLFRHPIDHICTASTMTYTPATALDGRLWGHPIYPLDIAPFRDGASSSEIIDYLISDGYLLAVLTWITDWLRCRDETRSRIIRYEDIIKLERRYIDDLMMFLFDRRLNDEVFDECRGVFGERKRTVKLDDEARRYEHGWTGRQGIYEEYMTADQIAAYKSVVDRFVDSHPHAARLTGLYPDLSVV